MGQNMNAILKFGLFVALVFFIGAFLHDMQNNTAQRGLSGLLVILATGVMGVFFHRQFRTLVNCFDTEEEHPAGIIVQQLATKKR